MAISRLSQTTLQNAFQKFNTVWDGTSAVGSMDAIGVSVLGAAAADITFSSIPQTYTHLQIRLFSNSTVNPDIFYQFNGVTTSTYTRHYMYSTGSVGAGSSLTQSSGSLGYSPISSNTNMFGCTIFDLLDYTNTSKYKTTRSLTGYDINTAGMVVAYSGLWPSTAAVNTIRIFPNPTSNFGQYTHAALYGIK